MEVKAIILCSSQACLFISETTSAFPSKVKCSSPSHEEWAGGEWDTQSLLGHAVSCFWSERQLNNIGHAYFYLMGVAFYSYSSFQPGRLEWTNFVSWGRNILPCFWKKAVKFRSPGTKFLTKYKFSFQFITSLAKFRRHTRCTEILNYLPLFN